MKRVLSLLLILILASTANAQESTIWSLEKCVSYALAHNLSIKQNELNARLAELKLKQSQLSQLPNLNIGPSLGRSFGRSVDPTTNQFVTGSYDFFSFSGSADVLLFGWFQKRNTIRQNELSSKASVADLDQLKDDISLNIATGYLRALLAKEQINVSKQQVAFSQQQLLQTQKFAESGRLPQLNVAQHTSQLATDSASLITAIANYNSSILDLKALLNLDFESPFEIQARQTELGSFDELLKNTPASIYAVAAGRMGTIKSSILKLQAAKKQLDVAKGNRLPTLSFSAQLGSNYASTYKDYGNPSITGTRPNGTYVQIDTNYYPVYEPTYTIQSLGTTPFNTQFNNNLRHTYVFSLNIPVFNAWQASANVKQSKINILSQELNKTQASITLQQNVYKAYNDAQNSLQKYNAAMRVADASGQAFNYGKQRYDIGMTNTIELLTLQNNKFAADANLASAKYDLIFRLKVIDYYLGKALKL